MQKIISSLIILVLCLAAVPAAFGSPLVFKITKRLDSAGTVGTVDTSKLGRIRISLTLAQAVTGSKATAEINLNLSKRELERVKGLVEQGVNSRLDYDRAKTRLDEAQTAFDNTSPVVSIYAMEGADEVLLMELDSSEKFRSFVIESPPSKIIVKVSDKGDYKLFVWGQ
jgi:hypothetical protein